MSQSPFPHSLIYNPIGMKLKQSGINTDIFQTHSVRAASSYKVHSKGLFTDDILSMGNWSRESTWQKFYHILVEL